MNLEPSSVPTTTDLPPPSPSLVQRKQPADPRRWLSHSNFLVGIGLGLIVIVLSILEISGSSIAVMNEFTRANDYKDPNLILGTPRWVRGDEWLVATPLSAAQRSVDFAHVNYNVTFGQEMQVLYDIPTNHWSTLFKPQNWPFLMLPLENAIAFKWWFRAALLIFSAYLLTRELFAGARGQLILAFGASLTIFLTPFVQWWYSTSAVDYLAYFCLIIYGFIKIIKGESLLLCLAHSGLIAFCLIAGIFLLYPPFLVPLFLLATFVVIGYMANEKDRLSTRKLRLLGLSVTVIASMTLVAVAAFYLSLGDVLRTMNDTVYPGRRVVSGGGYSELRFFSGFFDFLLLKTNDVPSFLSNESEASSSFFLFPWMAPTILYASISRIRQGLKVDFVPLACLLYVGLVSVWLFLGFPHVIEKLLLLNRVPLNRAIIGLVLANFFLVFYFLASDDDDRRPAGWQAVAIATCALVLASHLYFGYEIRDKSPQFIGTENNIWFAASVATLLTGALLFRMRRLFVAGVFVFACITSFAVNPLYRGLDPLVDSPLARQLEPIREADPDAGWLAYGTLVYGNYLVGNGFHVFSSTQFYPQEDFWLRLDPQQRFRDNWNRFAHLIFALSADEQTILFENQDYDSVTVSIHPCNRALRDLNVNYILSLGPIDASCLERILPGVQSGEQVFIYRRRR